VAQREPRRGFWARVRGGARRTGEAVDLLDGVVLVLRALTWPLRMLGRLFDAF
jgi:hypothetical protein